MEIYKDCNDICLLYVIVRLFLKLQLSGMWQITVILHDQLLSVIHADRRGSLSVLTGGMHTGQIPM